jgi:hypothetical protein
VLGLTARGVVHTWDLAAPSAAPLRTYAPPQTPLAPTQQRGSLALSGDGRFALLGLPQLGAVQVREGVREWTWWARTGGGNALAFKQPT